MRSSSRRGKRREIYARYEGRCQLCIECDGKTVLEKKETTLQHIVPVVLGGTDDIDNLTLSCDPCNQTDSKFYNKFGKGQERAKHLIALPTTFAFPQRFELRSRGPEPRILPLDEEKK